MTRLYGDPENDAAEVRRRGDEPEQFRWRDRLYRVRRVLGHWVESGGWWSPDLPDDAAADCGNPDDRERELWRVEAVGQLGETGVFDLCLDWSQGRWTVARVQD